MHSKATINHLLGVHGGKQKVLQLEEKNNVQKNSK